MGKGGKRWAVRWCLLTCAPATHGKSQSSPRALSLLGVTPSGPPPLPELSHLVFCTLRCHCLFTSALRQRLRAACSPHRSRAVWSRRERLAWPGVMGEDALKEGVGVNLTSRQAALQQVGQAAEEASSAGARRWGGQGECWAQAGELRMEGCVGQTVATPSQETEEGLVHPGAWKGYVDTSVRSPGESGSSLGGALGGRGWGLWDCAGGGVSSGVAQSFTQQTNVYRGPTKCRALYWVLGDGCEWETVPAHMELTPWSGRGRRTWMEETGTTPETRVEGLLTAHLLCAGYREPRLLHGQWSVCLGVCVHSCPWAWLCVQHCFASSSVSA